MTRPSSSVQTSTEPDISDHNQETRSIMNKIVVITGASSGFGALTARTLALAGHTVYAGMRDLAGRNAQQVAEVAAFSAEHSVDLRAVGMDVTSTDSVDAAIAHVIEEEGRIDVLIHNAGHMSSGAAEAFTPEQFMELYDVNVVSTQRVNRAALPHMRAAGNGLVIWVSSSSVKGGTPPYISPYFAAKAAMDSLAVSYAGELARWGVETSIVVPGSFTSGTNHFLHSGRPADAAVAAEYEVKYGGLIEQVSEKLAALSPADADASWVSDEIARIVALPDGDRPFRVHIDPANDGSEEVSEVADRIRIDFLKRVGLEDLLTPHHA
ncbi:SDR family oxidoreductase [Microbacterium maritypicum]|uniref:SDR family oxidoreductase n=1 Tax=Microbacterium maritypicum TaxID=33918 RepID=UPI00381566AC